MNNPLKQVMLALLLVSASSVRGESIEQFHQDYYTQMCTSLIACASHVDIADQLQWLRITNVDSCVTVISEEKEAETWREPLTSKKAVFNPNVSKACLNAIAGLSCNEVAGLGRNTHNPSFVEGCEEVIVGKIENSQKCSSDLECKSKDAGCYDTCEPPATLNPCGDDACSVATEFCQYETQICSAYKDIGEACLRSSECKDECSAGFCKAPLPVVKPGGQCGKDFGRTCSIGEFCAEAQCTPFRKKSENCSTEDKQFKWCEALLVCEENKCV